MASFPYRVTSRDGCNSGDSVVDANANRIALIVSAPSVTILAITVNPNFLSGEGFPTGGSLPPIEITYGRHGDIVSSAFYFTGTFGPGNTITITEIFRQ